MRYTTIIDIREDRRLYSNVNVRLVYLHLCLIAGYHDDDRDFADISLRRLADDVGITLSATRHALKVLSALSLLSIEDGRMKVTKWLPDKSITRRPRNARERSEQAIIEERQRQAAQEDHERRQRQEMKTQQERTGKSAYQRHIDALEEAAARGDEKAMAALKRHKNMNKT